MPQGYNPSFRVMPLGHKLERKTIMTRLMPLRHKVSVYGTMTVTVTHTMIDALTIIFF
jgi:hypothetical protein